MTTRAPIVDRLIALVPSFLLIVALLLVWELGVAFGWIKAFLFPPPSAILDAFASMFTEGFPLGLTLLSHLGATMPRVIQGYLFLVSRLSEALRGYLILLLDLSEVLPNFLF